MNTTKRVGRPRQFDEELALDSALHPFWQAGYASTSLDDLTTAMAMNRPSLYACFGNKERLYEAAIRRYMETYGQTYLDMFIGHGSLRDDLTELFRRELDTVLGAFGPGCPVACTLPAETQNSPRIKALLVELLERMDRAALKRVKLARQTGELVPGLDPRAIAKLIVNTIFALSIRARSGASRHELNAIARTFVTLITTPGR